MNHKIQLSLLSITLGLLTACGSSGGSNKNNGDNINSNSSSLSYVRDDLKEEVRDAKKLVISNKFNREVIQTISLADYPKGIVKETVRKNDKAFTYYLRAVNQAYSGSVVFNSSDPKFLFSSSQNLYVGIPTKKENLPKGNASYQGHSVGSDSSGTLALNADFDNKTVSGRIYNRSKGNGVKLPDAELQKTSISTGFLEGFGFNAAVVFNGNTLSNRERGSYEGMFMGPNAEEVVGSWTTGVSHAPTEVFGGERK